MKDAILDELIGLSNHLGDPALDYVILAEGNTSARADDASFWVKASGSRMPTAGPEDFVRVRTHRVLEMLEAGDLTDAEVRDGLRAARLDGHGGAMPSVETLMHAVLLGLEGVRFVGHTHPTAINAITCADGFEDALAGRLFPDEIVLCGPHPLLVPYVDPGVPLARAIRNRLETHRARRGGAPQVIYLQNHGFIALGATARQVEDVTAMAVKTARIITGTAAFGGPRFLGPAAVDRIDTRPDEHERQRRLGLRDGG